MKLDALLQQYPWDETRAALFREPRVSADLPLETAERLIKQQRTTQVDSLLSVMLSPRLVPEFASERAASPGSRREEHAGMFELRDPRRTARLFIDRSARTGKDLRPFSLVDLDRLGADDAALGRILRLLAIAIELPRAERAGQAGEWARVPSQSRGFGLVLTAMLRARSDRKTRELDPDVKALTRELVGRMDELPSSEQLTAEGPRLPRWVGSLAREGQERIRELRGEPKRRAPRGRLP